MISRCLLAISGLVLLMVGGCTQAPYRDRQQRAIGYVEESVGDRYTVTARELTAEWIFSTAAPFTLSFQQGDVTYEGTELEAGCYTGVAEVGDTLAFEQAAAVRFTYPTHDADCTSLEAVSLKSNNAIGARPR